MQVPILSSGLSPWRWLILFLWISVILKLLCSFSSSISSSVSSSLSTFSSSLSALSNSLSSVSGSLSSTFYSSLSTFSNSLSTLSYSFSSLSSYSSVSSSSVNSSAVSRSLYLCRISSLAVSVLSLLLITRNKCHSCNSSNHQYQLFHFSLKVKL